MSERMYSLPHLGHGHRISQVDSFKKPAFLISAMSRMRNQDISQAPLTAYLEKVEAKGSDRNIQHHTRKRRARGVRSQH
ncbi:MAG TPA: hypothetical protein VEM15_16535, partial [Thermodesulfobacteriota bacterium]|nr:hypothetical protein [Thermodesulfobacteriota bacterium]